MLLRMPPPPHSHSWPRRTMCARIHFSHLYFDVLFHHVCLLLCCLRYSQWAGEPGCPPPGTLAPTCLGHCRCCPHLTPALPPALTLQLLLLQPPRPYYHLN